MPSEAWLEAVAARIREIFAADQRIAQVTIERGGDTSSICRLIAEEADERTVVGVIEPADEWARVLTHAVSAFGLADSPLDQSDDSAARRLRQVFDAFLESLVAIGARCLLVIDRAELLGSVVLRELMTLSYEAAGNRWPLYVVLIQHEPVAEPVAVAIRPSWSHRRRQIAAMIAISLIGVASAFLYSRHTSQKTPAPPPAAVPARTSLRSESMLGTAANDSSRWVPEQPTASAGVFDLRDPSSRQAVLRRAAQLARQPDVRALLDLRQSVQAQGGAADVRSISSRLDAFVEEARRRQLELDHRRLSEVDRTSSR